MLHVLLTILAVIGWILLGILGLLILIVLMVLLSPISYRAGVEKEEEELSAFAKAKYLFGIIKAGADFSEGKFSFKVKLFGKVIKGDGAKNKDEEAEDEEAENETGEGTVKKEKSRAKKENKEKKDSEDKKKTEESKNSKDKKEAEGSKDSEDKKETEEKEESGKKKFGNKVSGGFENFTNTIEHLEKEENVKIIGKLLHNVGVLFKEILPRYFGGDITIGTGDPCSTGKVMGVAAVMYGRYGKSLRIYPNFEEKQLECHLETKGYTTLFAILFVVAKIYFSKKNRKLLKEVKTIWGKN